MKKIFKLLGGAGLPLLALSAGMTACKPDPSPVPRLDSGKVAMAFSNVVGSQPLVFQQNWYQNPNGDSFNVTLFAYYISNIRLNRVDGGDAYVQPQSYHLLDGYNRPETMSFDLDSVADGTYNSVTLTIGVDSARNAAGAGTGALDQIWGYYWSWNAGYIFLKFEGYDSKSLAANKMEFHIGGYQGPNSTIRTITLPFSNTIQVARGKKASVQIEADVLKLFDTPNRMDFGKTKKIHMPGEDAKKLADNYANMLRIKSTSSGS